MDLSADTIEVTAKPLFNIYAWGIAGVVALILATLFKFLPIKAGAVITVLFALFAFNAYRAVISE
jgi:hypothetical protein